MSHLIGGYPSEKWVGRRMKFWGHENKQHGTPCRLVAIRNGRAQIRPESHNEDIIIPVEKLQPWWGQNPDLPKVVVAEQAPLQILPQKHAWVPKYEVVEPVPAPVEEPVTITVTQIEEPMIPPKKKPEPKTVCHRPMLVSSTVNSSWIDEYQKYLEAASDRDEALSLLKETEARMTATEERLAGLGVTFQDTLPKRAYKKRNQTPGPKAAGAKVTAALTNIFDALTPGVEITYTYAGLQFLTGLSYDSVRDHLRPFMESKGVKVSYSRRPSPNGRLSQKLITLLR